jgi:poly-gamma-glutamate capsule biosynthesis protein CapA/YwtB (metallophosphatase superfamily)
MEQTRSRSTRINKRRRRAAGVATACLLLLAAALVVWRSMSTQGTGSSDNQAREAAGSVSSSPSVSDTPAHAAKDKDMNTLKPTATAVADPSATPDAAKTAVVSTDSGQKSDGQAKPGDTGDGKSASGGMESVKPSTVSGITPDTPIARDTNRVQLSFVGDVLLGSTVQTLLKKNGYDYPYSGLKDELKRPDLTIANLETPITTGGVAQSKEFVYRSSPDTLPSFKSAGFDLVNLANNHIMDYGREGLMDTFGHLENNGIKYVGAGRNAEEAFSPVILESKGMKIAFLGFSRVVPDGSWKAGKKTPGVADTYSYKVPVEYIKKARKMADLVVVIAHWGTERQDRHGSEQTDLAHRYIDAGADLIIGGHPHVLQGFEQYKGKWIAYSTGNFIFTTRYDVRKTLDSAIVEASCSKSGSCDLNLIPVYTELAKPVQMTGDSARKLLARLTQVSVNARIEANGQIVGTSK